MTTSEPTTAQILGQYRRDLIAEGFSDTAADTLAFRMAGGWDAAELLVGPIVEPRAGRCGCMTCCGRGA